MEASFLVGTWNATIVQTIPCIFLAHFFFNGDNIVGYVDIPGQNLNKLRIDIFKMHNDHFFFNTTSIKSSFESTKIESSSIEGFWHNTSGTFRLEFLKINNRSEYAVKRPQTPKHPFNYIEEEIELKNRKENITLSGTFTYKKDRKPVAAVVLCHGSGGLDRDETGFDHKIFMVIADYLTNNDIAVLRFDERGIRNSTGDFFSATDIDFTNDVLLGINFLKKRNETKNSLIGVIGHSKGGSTAMLAANRSEFIKFMVLLGATGIPGEQIMYIQTRLILKSINISESVIETSINGIREVIHLIKIEKNNTVISQHVKDYFSKIINEASGQEKAEFELIMENILIQVDLYITAWFRKFIVFDPQDILSHIKIPVLGLWGESDVQVPPKDNFMPVKLALEKANNTDFKLMTFENLNHLFQFSETGSPSEYEKIEETFSKNVLEIISIWIRNRSFEN